MSKSDHSLEERVAARTALLEQALRGQGELLADARRAHALLASTFNAIGDAIIVTDAAGRITQANSAVAHLFNRTPEEVISDTCRSLLAEGQPCPHSFAPEHEGVVERELLNRERNRVLNLRVTGVTDPEQPAAGFLHIIRDVTRERVIERHLVQAERMSLAGLLVSAVAHEVATPLSVVANRRDATARRAARFARRDRVEQDRHAGAARHRDDARLAQFRPSSPGAIHFG